MNAPLLPVDVTIGTPDPAVLPPAPPYLSDDPALFGYGVLHTRHPALIEQTRAAHPYGPRQHTALDALLEEATTGVVHPLGAGAPDRGTWDTWGAPYFGQPWDHTPFLWAESYLYRRLLDAVDYFTPGPWYGVDPFAHLKNAELRDSALEQNLRDLDRLADLDPDKRTEALLLASLWGNRADLGFRIGLQAATSAHHDAAGLVADDTPHLTDRLLHATGRIDLIADNAGRELLADLILVDHLLQHAPTIQISLHVKPTPYYVSDATTTDVVACLRRLAATPGTSAHIAERLTAASRRGQFTITTHWFYSAPYSFHFMPPDLIQKLSNSALIIAKGDLNYRRLVGDCSWDPDTPFADATSYLQLPVAAIRTLKSDVVVGIGPADVASLDGEDDQWRTNGTRGLIQLHTKTVV